MFSNNQQIRTHESPMDFEWNGQSQGPVDPKSPFPQHKPGQKRGFQSSQYPESFGGIPAVPAPQFRNPSFTTPRKPTEWELNSDLSGIDSSPGGIADGEDTPDLPRTTKAMTIFSIKSDKAPVFGKYGASTHSPGRSERPRHANSLARNIRKRQKTQQDIVSHIKRRRQSHSGSDSGESRPRTQGNDSNTEPHWLGSLMSWIERHPNLPGVLSYYAQLILNFFLVGMSVLGIWSFYSTIKADVDKEALKATQAVVAEIAQCGRAFIDNGCQRVPRVPALESVCEAWENCMNRDPDLNGRAKISARTFAEILNSFIEPISWKAMSFVFVVVVSAFFINNFVFGIFRSKLQQQHPMPPFYAAPGHQYNNWPPHPPQTPSHSNGHDIYGNQMFPQIMPSQTPNGRRSPSKGSRSPSKGDRDRSPSKGDRY